MLKHIDLLLHIIDREDALNYNLYMSLITVGVLRGGPSNEYDVSLATGANVLKAIHEKLSASYTARDILIDKKGIWHLDGLPRKIEEILASICL